MLENFFTSPQHWIGHFITAAILGGMFWLLGRSKPSNLGLDYGTILPDKWSAMATVAGGTLVFAFAANAALFGDGGFWTAVLALVSFAMAGFMVPSLTTIHAVHWDKHGIEGPSRLFGPTLGIARTRIPWDKIVAGGETITQYYFVESKDGRRVYWSGLYRGHGFLLETVVAKCPHLLDE